MNGTKAGVAAKHFKGTAHAEKLAEQPLKLRTTPSMGFTETLQQTFRGRLRSQSFESGSCSHVKYHGNACNTMCRTTPLLEASDQVQDTSLGM